MIRYTLQGPALPTKPWEDRPGGKISVVYLAFTCVDKVIDFVKSESEV
jgi:hypothetical protein